MDNKIYSRLDIEKQTHALCKKLDDTIEHIKQLKENINACVRSTQERNGTPTSGYCTSHENRYK